MQSYLPTKNLTDCRSQKEKFQQKFTVVIAISGADTNLGKNALILSVS